MKILHTSDWHIGKMLHKIDLSDDMNLFFEWLVNEIKQQEVDVLLMSGDLFDQANPSQVAMQQYYAFLKRLLPLQCKVILTGGNHDSPYVLNAPRELLQVLDVHVMGGAPENVADLFVSYEKNGEKVVFAAVPYLREKDIRNAAPGESYADKIELVREGMAHYFETVNAYYKANFHGTPFILMGHLFAQGVEVSESEREIQIGNQASVEAAIFGNEAHYVALGHIHKPQSVGNAMIRYSGSPIALSFSEKKDEKQCILIQIEDGTLTFEKRLVPVFRRLVQFSGTLQEIQTALDAYQTSTPLMDLAEVQITEELEQTGIFSQIEELQTPQRFPSIEIVKVRVNFLNKLKGTSAMLEKSARITDFTPKEMFLKRLESDASLLEIKDDLVLAFSELIEQ